MWIITRKGDRNILCFDRKRMEKGGGEGDVENGGDGEKKDGECNGNNKREFRDGSEDK